MLKKAIVVCNKNYRLSISLLTIFFATATTKTTAQCSTGCTYTVSSNNSTSYTLTSGQKLCITSSGTITGSITLAGGTLCNQGTFNPASFSSTSGTFDNYNTATVSSINLSGAVQLNNYSGATLTITSGYTSSAPAASFINNGTCTIAAGCAASAGILSNNGNLSIGTTLGVTGGTFSNNNLLDVSSTSTISGGSFTNSGTFTTHGISPSGGSFTNSGTITNTGDFANSGVSTSNTGTISNTGNFTNSAAFSNASGATVSCVNLSLNGGVLMLNGGKFTCTNFTNSGTINGPGLNTGCATISASTSTTNSGTINNYTDICDATPPAGTIKIDNNSGTVASTVTYCSCCLLNTPGISGTTTICNGSSATLSASSGTSYSWSNSASTQSITVNPTATTAYTVTITYANSCTRTVSQTITVNPQPTVNAGTNTNICTGSSATLGGSPTASGTSSPYTYSWLPATALSSTTIANPTASPTETIIYTVIVTDSKGCIATSSTMIEAISNPTVDAGYNFNICSGNSTIIGGNPTASNSSFPYVYSWSPAISLNSSTIANPTATPNISTAYTVYVTDNNGCTNTSSVTIAVNTPPTVTASASKDSICVGDNIILTGNGAQSYLWTNGAVDNLSITPEITTSYIVTGTDSHGCTSSSSITVIVNNLPTANTSVSPSVTISPGGKPNTIYHGRGAQSLTLAAIVDTNTQSYSWSPAKGLTCTECLITTASPTVTTTYTLTLTGTNGCTASQTITIYVIDINNLCSECHN
ncbi:MAG: hypothetical protein IT235_00235 [Bacteroidia bacterium]|nr:hypothetical protein [Bacteroidia bacterium]